MEVNRFDIVKVLKKIKDVYLVDNAVLNFCNIFHTFSTRMGKYLLLSVANRRSL